LGVLVPRFLGFEARLVSGHKGSYRCPGWGCLDLGCGYGGGLGFGGAILQVPWRRLRVRGGAKPLERPGPEQVPVAEGGLSKVFWTLTSDASMVKKSVSSISERERLRKAGNLVEP
jgi:hypothetical protein